MVTEITDDTFESEVLDAKGVVIVDFYADWCMPCKMLEPILEKLSRKVKVVKINVENSSVATLFHIQSLPTILIFIGGNVIGEIVGYLPEKRLVEKIKKLVEFSILEREVF